MGKFIDHTNEPFGRLIAIKYVRRDKRGNAIWHCICKCGNEIEAFANNLRRGLTQSCGCLRKENSQSMNITHGGSVKGRLSPEFQVYRGMLQRCLNSKHGNYEYYGGRGIKICERWLKGFSYFLKDMGPRPLGKSLDRIDVDGNYEPRNCRWATAQEQQNNKRNSVSVVAEHVRQRHKMCQCPVCKVVRELVA